MTSKEVLKIIETYNYWNGAEEITGNTCVNPIYLEAKKHYEEAKDILENNLEVLEIIKKRQIDIKDIIETTDDYELYRAYCVGKEYADEYICNKEEFNKLKEWLENEK